MQALIYARAYIHMPFICKRLHKYVPYTCMLLNVYIRVHMTCLGMTSRVSAITFECILSSLKKLHVLLLLLSNTYRHSNFNASNSTSKHSHIYVPQHTRMHLYAHTNQCMLPMYACTHYSVLYAHIATLK